ncbi:MAG: FAD-dependent oxidoreductase [Gemmatimonadaceae bacterium]
MQIAIVGGGINGVMTAWELARRGHAVQLLERHSLMSGTSSASTKLLHGGLRYLQQGDVRLVYEALHERAWWLRNAPHLTAVVEIFFPIYEHSPRGRVMLEVGLTLYDRLAGKAALGAHRWWRVSDLPPAARGLSRHGLRGAFSYFDAQMDDSALGLWAADQARGAGVTIAEHTEVSRISTDGEVVSSRGSHRFDVVVNATGPWAKQILEHSDIASATRLDLVRGSHLVVGRPLSAGFALQIPHDDRLVFALPYHGRTLIGTTEVRQSLLDPIECSAEERQYLLSSYNMSFAESIADNDVETTFAGVRPLVDAGFSPNEQRRGARIETHDRTVTIFGGKWTTARTLGHRAANAAEKLGSLRR